MPSRNQPWHELEPLKIANNNETNPHHEPGIPATDQVVEQQACHPGKQASS
jgi:hypothetical protein